jgi:hypothetical protein
MYRDLQKSRVNLSRLSHSFHRQVIDYIESCHLEDGGYFFARVLPSGGTDTYYAVKSLSILGVKPKRPEAVADFFLRQMRQDSLGGITGIFDAVEVLGELGRLTDDLRHRVPQATMAFRNEAGGFGATKNIYLEVPSELEATYRAVRILRTLGAHFEEAQIARFVLGVLNRDGGYGEGGRSTLASTYYATAIHRLLRVGAKKLAAPRAYLRKKERAWQIQFIENLFWLVQGLANLGEESNTPERAASFVLECQRRGGGFARAPIMGIPTLEYTFYALSILQELGGV